MKNLKLIIDKEDEEAWEGIREPKEMRFKRFQRGKVNHRGSLHKRMLRFRDDWEKE